MRAMVVEEYGGPEVLHLAEVDDPRPAAGEVAIAVEAAAVGLIDVLFRRDGLNGLVEPPFIPGIEVAGRVIELGPEVAGLVPGQPVVTLSAPGTAGYAEIATVSAERVIALGEPGDESIAPSLAVAAIPNLVTALAALDHAAHLQPDEDLLVFGATGGLASVFPLVAKSLGARSVTGVITGPDKIDRALSYGYDHVVLADNVETVGTARFDIIVDPVGGPCRESAFSLLRPLGRLLVVGNASGREQAMIGTNDLWLGNAAVIGVNIAGLLSAEPHRTRNLAARAITLIEEARVRLPFEVLPLADATEAHRRLEERTATGRLILRP